MSPSCPSPPPLPPLKFYVLSYKPHDLRDRCHWAFWLDSESCTVLNAQDAAGRTYFYIDTRPNALPRSSSTAHVKIPLGKLTEPTDVILAKMLDRSPLNHLRGTGYCQDWAMQVLDNLEKAGQFEWSSGAKRELSQRKEWKQ